MAHSTPTAYHHFTTSHGGGGGVNQSFGLLVLGLSAAVALASILLPPAALAVLSGGLLTSGFALAVALWRWPSKPWPDAVQGRDVAALLVLLGFIGALIGDTEALFH